MRDKNHKYYPLDSGYFNGNALMKTDSASRADRVRKLNLEECQAALNNKNFSLQKTIRAAIEIRMRKLIGFS